MLAFDDRVQLLFPTLLQHVTLHSSAAFLRPASRYSVGEMDRRLRNILAKPSPLPAPHRRAILSTGRSVAARSMQLASSRARNKYSEGVNPICALKRRRKLRSLIAATRAASAIEIGRM